MKPHREWFRLVEALCNDTITADEHEQLQSLLKESAEARQFYRDYMDIQAGLEQPMATEILPDTERVIPIRPRAWPSSGIPAVAAMVIAGLVTIYAFSKDSAQDQPDFVLTRATDVEWASDKFLAELGKPITSGSIRIHSGIVGITFASGAVVTMKGPAALDLHSPMKCSSKSGTLAVNCPPSAHGFVVQFSGGSVVDLGTEFVLESEAEGKTIVQVLTGEAIVALTDENENVLKKKNLKERTAVELDPQGQKITERNYDDEAFEDLKSENLLRRQPIRLQFDLGHRAGLYRGNNSPAHAAGDMFDHEDVWTQIVADYSGTLVTADGGICPHPIRVDYGHGNGEIDWDAAPVDPGGRIFNKAPKFFDNALCQDHRPWDSDLGLRVSGLRAGTYRIYALCRSLRRPDAAYDVSFGVNLERQLESPIEMPPIRTLERMKWESGLTYAVGDVEISGPNEWATLITRYSRERSEIKNSVHGRSVLLGLQIVELTKEKTATASK